MTVRGLILLLLFPLSIFGEQQYYGTRVVELSITGANPSDLQFIPLQRGDIITTGNVRASILALYETGRYSYIEVEAAPATGGNRLTFRVRPHFYFSTIQIESARNPKAEILERSLSSYLRLPHGEKFRTSEVERIASQTGEILESEGYFDAEVTPRIELNETTRLASVTLVANVGDKARLGNIALVGGEQTFTELELRDSLNLVSGKVFSADRLADGVAAIREGFTDLGFLNTRVTVAQQYRPADNRVDLTVNIVPGQFTLVQTRGYDISRDDLFELVPIFEEGSIDPDLVEEGRVEIRRFLQELGYFDAQVQSDIIEAPLDNAVQINYMIEPGERHTVRTVRIEGNRFFSNEAIRARIQVRSAGVVSRGVFSPEILNQDLRIIQGMYRSAGFENTEVFAEPLETDHQIEVIIRIAEGQRAPIRQILFEGNEAAADETLLQQTALIAGGIYTPPAVADARNALTSFYYSMGYPDVRIEPRTEPNADSGIDIVFDIAEGSAYRIGAILVAGNTITAEKIVHRNSNLYPDTPYNPEAILNSQQRLYATGLFNRVEIVPLDQDLAGVRNMLIQLEDAKPILLTYGVGVQDREGVRGTLELSHTNLFGLDRSISFRLRATLDSAREQRFQATYREPRLFNRDLDGFASLFIERTTRRLFDASRVDFSIQTLKQLSPAQSILITAGYQTVNLRDIRINPRADDFPQDQGTIQISKVGGSFIRDRRNDPINPETGSLNTTTFQVASRVLGSEVNFTSLFNQSAFYWPAARGVIASSLRFGWNRPFGRTQQLPVTERYFAGGSTTLRGYDLDEAGPEAGGNALLIGNLEYRFPIPLPAIRFLSGLGGAVFYDTGNVFSRIGDVAVSDFTHTAGLGFRYQTPLGPIRVDFGMNLRPKLTLDGMREERVQVFFTLGHTF